MSDRQNVTDAEAELGRINRLLALLAPAIKASPNNELLPQCRDGLTVYRSFLRDHYATLQAERDAAQADVLRLCAGLEQMTAERTAYRVAATGLATMAVLEREGGFIATPGTVGAMYKLYAADAVQQYGCSDCSGETFEGGALACWTCGRELPALAPAEAAQ